MANKHALYCNRQVNLITCICGYVETYHACDHVINRTIIIYYCPANCKVCQENINRLEYYDCKWWINKDGYAVCEMYRENLGFWDIWKVGFL